MLNEICRLGCTTISLFVWSIRLLWEEARQLVCCFLFSVKPQRTGACERNESSIQMLFSEAIWWWLPNQKVNQKSSKIMKKAMPWFTFSHYSSIDIIQPQAQKTDKTLHWSPRKGNKKRRKRRKEETPLQPMPHLSFCSPWMTAYHPSLHRNGSTSCQNLLLQLQENKWKCRAWERESEKDVPKQKEYLIGRVPYLEQRLKLVLHKGILKLYLLQAFQTPALYDFSISRNHKIILKILFRLIAISLILSQKKT